MKATLHKIPALSSVFAFNTNTAESAGIYAPADLVDFA